MRESKYFHNGNDSRFRLPHFAFSLFSSRKLSRGTFNFAIQVINQKAGYPRRPSKLVATNQITKMDSGLAFIVLDA